MLALGTRLQDFTTGSNTLFTQADVIGINANAFDGLKHRAQVVEADARLALDALDALDGLGSRLQDWHADRGAWTARAQQLAASWRDTVHTLTHAPQRDAVLPDEGDVIGAVQRSSANSPANDIVVCAAGTLPAELHKLWRAARRARITSNTATRAWATRSPAGSAVKLARPEREVIVMVGDGSYLMMNSEIATSVMLGAKLD